MEYCDKKQASLQQCFILVKACQAQRLPVLCARCPVAYRTYFLGWGPLVAARGSFTLAAVLILQSTTSSRRMRLSMCACRWRDTAVARASDDFYPTDKASYKPHLVACAFNALFLSPVALPDWDMCACLPCLTMLSLPGAMPCRAMLHHAFLCCAMFSSALAWPRLMLHELAPSGPCWAISACRGASDGGSRPTKAAL
jgi:hypothetical protein